jgi:hypothetical protein
MLLSPFGNVLLTIPKRFEVRKDLKPIFLGQPSEMMDMWFSSPVIVGEVILGV